MTRAEILLTINSNLEGIRKANEAVVDHARLWRNAQADISKSGKSISGVLSDFKATLMGGMGIGAGFAVGATAANVLLGTVRQITSQLKQTVTEGVRFNATLEQSRLGVASVLRQFAPDKYRDISSALSASAGIIDQLKKKALETSATFEDLLAGFQGTAGAMASAGIPLNRQVNLIVNLSQAMAALGIRTEEMRQEATALMMGTIDRNARLAQTLGITAEHIRLAKEQGRLYEFLTQKLAAFSEAAGVAANTITVLESNLKDARTQVAAEQTEGLATAYKGLLASLTALTTSNAYGKTLGFLANVAGFATLKFSSLFDGFGDLAPKRLRDRTSAFAETAKSVRSSEDVEAARATGRNLLGDLEWNFDASKPGSRKAESIGKLIAATRAELDLLEREGQQRIENNKKADDAAKIEALSLSLAKEAQKAREEGVKKYAEQSEKAQQRIRQAAKGSSPTWYLELLAFDKATLERQLKGPQANPDFYLGKGDASDSSKVRDAKTAAEAYRLGIIEKIAGVEKEIDATRDAQAKKAKTDHDQQTRANVRLLSVKAQEGSLAEKIVALNAEIAALDEHSLNYAADKLEIEQRIAKLKDDEAARLNAENSKAIQRRQQAAIDAIQDDRFITERTRRQLLYNAYLEEQRRIEDKINAARDYMQTQPEGSATRAQAQQELDALLTRRDVGIPHDLAQNNPLSWLEETKAGLVSLVDSFATVGNLIADTIGTALGSISSNITGLIMKTQTWGQALRNIGVTILTSIVSAIVQASVQWVARKIIEFAVGNTLRAAALAANAATAMALSAMWATPATLATIATFGGAAAQAPMSIGGAMGAVHAMSLFEKGGYTAEGHKDQPAGIVHAGEWVAPKWQVNHPFYGPMIAALEAGRIRGYKLGGWVGKWLQPWNFLLPSKKHPFFTRAQDDLNDRWFRGRAELGTVMDTRTDAQRAAIDAFYARTGSLVTSTPRMGMVTGSDATSSAPVESGGAESSIVNIGYFNTQQDAEQWLKTQRGRRVMVDFIRRNQYDL